MRITVMMTTAYSDKHAAIERQKGFAMKEVKQTISKTMTVTVDTDITTNDIFNWLCACNDAETLHYLGKAALNRARAIENPDDDVFHSL